MYDKYYTPAIEEFHIGFEYEENRYGKIKYEEELSNFNTAWYKECYNFNSPYFDSVKEDILNGCIRVKYLDVDDLVQLGFEHIGGKLTSDVLQLFRYNNNRYFVHLTYTRLSAACVIQIETSVFENSVRTLVVHSIGIKNKSELLKLMAQLNIL